MTGLEDILQAAMAAPADRRESAVRILRGELPRPEPYSTLAGLAKDLGFSTKTLQRWRIPGHDFGGSRRFRRSEVETYFESEAFQRRLAALRAERRQGT